MNDMTMTNPAVKPVKRTIRIDDLAIDEKFQPRQGKISAAHVRDLAKIIERDQPLDPLLVWKRPEDGKLVLMDGHHRLQAFERVGWTKGIRCLVFECDKDEARRLPMKHNSKTSLPLTGTERADYAWGLVLDTALSKRTTARTCGVGERSVARMRAVLKRYQEQAAEEGTDMDPPRSWWRAQRLGAEDRDMMSDEQREEWKMQVKETLIAKIGPDLKAAAKRCPEAVGDALAEVLGHDLDAVMEWLVGYTREHDFEFGDPTGHGDF